MSIQRKELGDRYSGISQMGKKEERLRAEALKIEENVMHGRSHLILPVVSDVHEYQKLLQEQMFHENKWHDKNFPPLASSTPHM